MEVRESISQIAQMAAIFNYSPLPENHIRLVRIISIESPPTCELYDAPFNDDLRFRAISYAWGSDKLTHHIKCNDKIMAVTESVADMFSSIAICDLCIDMPLWVDAVCINQRDNPEKAVQVQMMGSLYSQAEEVIVWLGMASDDSDDAMRQLNAWSMNEIFLGAESLMEVKAIPQGAFKAGLKPPEDRIYNAVEALYCRAWFTRLWVFQEIVLAQRCRIFCGSAEITLEQLVSVSRAIIRLGVHYFPAKPLPNDAIRSSIKTIFQMGSMKQVSDEPLALAPWKTKGDTLLLAQLMKIGDEKGFSNPHDRVYGFIGLATMEARKRISIDYSDQSPIGWSKTYLQCAKACIREDPSLSILRMLSNRPKGLPLPSWCPNFNANQRREDSFSPYSERSNAGIMKSTQLEGGLPKAWINEEKDILFAPGCQIDHVEEIVSLTFTVGVDDSDPEAKVRGTCNLAWERLCQSLSQRTLATGIEKDIIYIQTLLENEPIPGVGDTGLRRLLDLTKYAWSGNSFNQECKSFEVDAVRYFSGHQRQTCEGRMFFSTKGGRIGIGPPETQPGDLICILYGAKPLYVLRRDSNAKVPLQILGDAFVHGLMNLDDIYEQVKSKYEVFEIG